MTLMFVGAQSTSSTSESLVHTNYPAWSDSPLALCSLGCLTATPAACPWC